MANSSTRKFNKQNNGDSQAVSSEAVVIMFDDTFFNYTNIVFTQGKFFNTGSTQCSGLGTLGVMPLLFLPYFWSCTWLENRKWNEKKSFGQSLLNATLDTLLFHFSCGKIKVF